MQSTTKRPRSLWSTHTSALLLAAGLLAGANSWANDPTPAKMGEKPIGKIELPVKKKPLAVTDVSATSASNPKQVGNQVREALGTSVAPNKKLTVTVTGSGAAGQAAAPVTPQTSRAYLQARAAALAARGTAVASADGKGSEVHWSYEGENGPENWGKLKPEFNLCAIGKRQSPINIDEGNTLAGPAEEVQFNYTPSNAIVTNNGHTIQVDVQGENTITVRGSTYRLLQFHFHTPSEEQVNSKRFVMVAHLVHKNDEGQLGVVAVLMEIGGANPLIDKVWTYMPLDTNDRVRMPRDLLNLNELLPADQRYYQFMGSLTTPPCTEGVLWLVLKQPVKISKAQHRLFTQLYTNNARPVQPANGRAVRDAQ
jgi:carbonic anhydrase